MSKKATFSEIYDLELVKEYSDVDLYKKETAYSTWLLFLMALSPRHWGILKSKVAWPNWLFGWSILFPGSSKLFL